MTRAPSSPIAPKPYSGWNGTPSLRTTITSSGAPNSLGHLERDLHARIQSRLPGVLIRRLVGVLVLAIGTRYLWAGLG